MSIQAGEMRPLSPQEESLKRALQEKKKTDPLIGAKMGGTELLDRLLNGMKDERGVHIESLLTALGALAGLACQLCAFEELAAAGNPQGTGLLTVVCTDDGKKYYFGDIINKPLAENQYSVWTIAAGGAKRAGLETLPDVNDMFAHIAASVGGPAFGKPRVPDKHRAHDTIENYAATLWPALRRIVTFYCDEPAEWPLLFGCASQEAIVMAKDVIAPDISLRIVMESAITSSKIDPSPFKSVN